MNQLRGHCAASIIAVALVGCAESEDLGQPSVAVQAPEPERPAELRSLPQVTELPSDYRPIGELGGRGMFYAASDQPTFRVDDGDHYHGYDGPIVWAKNPKDTRTQGVLYGVEDDAIVAAGYLIRQVDLMAGKSFHGLTMRELDFPAAHSMTIDLVEGETEESNQYLLLLHFLPAEGEVQPMLQTGQLPSVESLPGEFVVFACDHLPETRFCPGMGRHYTDPTSVSRLADATFLICYGNDSRHQDLASILLSLTICRSASRPGTSTDFTLYSHSDSNLIASSSSTGYFPFSASSCPLSSTR